MAHFTRRDFLLLATGATLMSWKKPTGSIITVTGSIDANELGTALTHEHVLVDFIGADKINYSRWNREDVLQKVRPYFLDAKKAGVRAIFECTPAFLGRDPLLLKMLSTQTGIRIITNTGYYGAVNNKYLPAWALTASPEQMAEKWIAEFENGIEETGIRPGFIKISVDAGPTGLSDIHKNIVRAAAIAHKHTGLTINSHTGPATAAFEQIEILKKENVAPNAFVWVHAQAEQDDNNLVKAAQMGAWVSLDNISSDFEKYADRLRLLKQKDLLKRTLISHDAGYYKPGEPHGGEYKGYTDIFTELIPRLKKNNFTKEDIEELLIKNPAEAMSVRIRS